MLESIAPVWNSLRMNAAHFAIDTAADVAVATHFSAKKSKGLRKSGALLVRNLAIAAGAALSPEPVTPDVIVRPRMAIKTRRWTVGIEVRGHAGEVKVIQVQPQVLFHGERIMALDDSIDPGAATYIEGLSIGIKPQIPVHMGWGVSTRTFAPNVIGNDITMDVCDPALFMTFSLRFLENCTWYGVVFGKAAL